MSITGRKKIHPKFLKRKNILSSVQKALSLIEYICRNASVGVSEAAIKLKTAKSTAYRILSTLEDSAFVIQCQKTGKYKPGTKLIELEILKNSLRNSHIDLDTLHHILKKLSKESGENAIFAYQIPSEDNFIVVSEVLSSNSLIARPMLYEKFSILSSPVGIAYLSTFKKHEANRKIEELIKKEKELKISEKNILKQINNASKLKYYCAEPAKHPELTMMATPTFSSSGIFKGCLAIFGPKFRHNSKQSKKWGKILLASSKTLSSVIQ
ncbi:MAG TPA: helix-turn-helix domain-containing protein [Victivallales bacterium]|nr:helix-turn-helix domain-containing protein [Victivallales bacterium]HRR28433.1 helix-turn-helix domain-containing protein [Victivallales bacterium]HRU00316.1 helix-turn-helix domain-containing protein [Victivallales bacterium]